MSKKHADRTKEILKENLLLCLYLISSKDKLLLQMYLSKSGFLLHQLFLHGVLFITGITCLPNIEDTCRTSLEKPQYRLSKDVVPHSYEIKITSFEMESFVLGDSKIHIEILKATSNISFHSQHPEMYDDLITLSDEKEFVYKPKVNHTISTNIIDLYFKDQLSPGHYTLNISYKYSFDYFEKQEAIFVILIPDGHDRK